VTRPLEPTPLPDPALSLEPAEPDVNGAGQVSRRSVLGALGLVGVGAAAGAGGFAIGRRSSGSDPATLSASAGSAIAFHGDHQAGIATPAQDRLIFGAFDVTAADRSALVALLKLWTATAARLTLGQPAGDDNADDAAPPDDTGEALGLSPARLTITFGFGPGLFSHAGVDRFGVAARRPAALVDLPDFPGDQLDPGRSGGDLAVQVCADDPQVAYHALRNLTRQAKGSAVLRWAEVGFGRTSSTSRTQDTLRNLQGFKDGTNNLSGDDAEAMDRYVWIRSGDGAGAGDWAGGGSYLVARRIRMFLETWDRSTLADQEATIGRAKASGAPLGATEEHDPADLRARQADGTPVIPADAHIRLAAHASNAGARILRRGYSFTDGIDPVTGQLDGGLFFIGYQRDPRTAFIPIQRRLAGHDALNEYIVHTGSAVFVCPPGVASGGWIGETLFG
jgi:deferrochelatase/peroxidase EfeB